MGMNTGSKFILGFLMGCMTGFDMGGPVNKICFSVVSAFAASGVWGPAAGKNAPAMAPPLGMANSKEIYCRRKRRCKSCYRNVIMSGNRRCFTIRI